MKTLWQIQAKWDEEPAGHAVRRLIRTAPRSEWRLLALLIALAPAVILACAALPS